jgi:hypothetical protein
MLHDVLSLTTKQHNNIPEFLCVWESGGRGYFAGLNRNKGKTIEIPNLKLLPTSKL